MLHSVTRTSLFSSRETSAGYHLTRRDHMTEGLVLELRAVFSQADETLKGPEAPPSINVCDASMRASRALFHRFTPGNRRMPANRRAPRGSSPSTRHAVGMHEESGASGACCVHRRPVRAAFVRATGEAPSERHCRAAAGMPILAAPSSPRQHARAAPVTNTFGNLRLIGTAMKPH